MNWKNLFLLTLMTGAWLLPQPIMARNFADLDVVSEIKKFNGSVISTQPDYFQEKIALMADGVFPFLRGTAHIMNLDMNKTPALEYLRKAPVGLVAGDLHMHNFSILKVDGKAPTYAIDDLDEAFANAPLSFDIFRLSVSLAVGFAEQIDRESLKPVLEQLYAGYCQRAADQYITDWPAIPMSDYIKEFIADESDVKWSKFIKKKTAATDSNSFDYSKHESVPLPEKKIVIEAMRGYLNQIASSNSLPIDHTEILDVAQRFDKGLSSIGLKRYFILLRGETPAWQDDRIIEAKLIRLSSVNDVDSIEKQAHNTLEGMARAHQARDPYLGSVSINGQLFLVRQNFPWKETIENTTITEQQQIAELAYMLGYITADFHAQSGQGTAMKAWLEESGSAMIPWVFTYADQLKADWQALRKSGL